MTPSRSILSVLFASALAARCLTPDVAHAKGDASGSLGAGGRARGDISKDTGETDRIRVDLDAGAALRLRLSASFEPRIVVTGPDGAPLDVGAPQHGRLRVRDRPIMAGGTYEVAVSSLDGSQGTYALAVSERWPRKVPVSGTGAAVVDVGMPAGGRIGCIVRGAAGVSAAPEILRLEDPTNADLLAASIEPRGNVAKLPPTPTSLPGVYHLIIGVTGGGGAWTGQVTRTVPSPTLARLVLTNGLDTISFAADGVRSLFVNRCAPCHAWAASYGGVRAYVYSALGRMRSGSMPPTGRIARADIALVQEWIKTGRKP